MLTIIVAFDDNYLMGTPTGLPWRIPAELRHFKETTMGHPIIMGRRTWEMLPKKPLPGRTNIVVSNTLLGAEPTLAAAIARAKKESSKEIFVIGGLQLYLEALRVADRVLVSKIPGNHQGTVYFPKLWGWQGRCLRKEHDFEVWDYYPVSKDVKST